MEKPCIAHRHRSYRGGNDDEDCDGGGYVNDGNDNDGYGDGYDDDDDKYDDGGIVMVVMMMMVMMVVMTIVVVMMMMVVVMMTMIIYYSHFPAHEVKSPWHRSGKSEQQSLREIQSQKEKIQSQ